MEAPPLGRTSHAADEIVEQEPLLECVVHVHGGGEDARVFAAEKVLEEACWRGRNSEARCPAAPPFYTDLNAVAEGMWASCDLVRTNSEQWLRKQICNGSWNCTQPQSHPEPFLF